MTARATGRRAPDTVLFVCLHGSAKSVIAAEHFRRLAAARGLAVGAEAAGTDPDPEIPPAVVAGLGRDGIDVRGRRPRRITRAALARASRVVAFGGCDLAGLAPPAMPLERWDDVPAVGEDFVAARDAILARLAGLLARCEGARTLLLTRRDVASLLGLEECIDAVERALRLHAAGRSLPPGILELVAGEGGFHVKGAGLELGRRYVAVKTNGNFPRNPARWELPAIQGVVALMDGERGTPLAIMDSIEITRVRTGAATAVAARYLARPEARVATICGCGNQGRVQLRALARVRPLARAYAFDADAARARAFARELAEELRIEIEPVRDLGAAARRSDLCVTCTPARAPLLGRGAVAPGSFVAAVGADGPGKQELDPALVASSTLVVDSLEQCATIGELHHALAAGLLTREAVHAELADVVAGRRPGRTRADEIVVFDSTGTALQDVAAAAAVYEKARRTRRGIEVDLAG